MTLKDLLILLEEDYFAYEGCDNTVRKSVLGDIYHSQIVKLVHQKLTQFYEK